jgi:DNA replicative helicase MCM subunit Mcm2 (Cdc46/Mcm family)
MTIEGTAAVLAKAVLAKLGTETVGKMVANHQDHQALECAIEEAWRATAERHGKVLARYDVNRAFLALEGADEVARVFLAGRGPNARLLARAYLLSLGRAPTVLEGDPLVEPFQTFLDVLIERLSRHARFRTRLHEVMSTRSCGVDDLDEHEYLEWLVRHLEFLQTAGIGTTQHLQLALRDVFMEPQALREERAGMKWSTRADEQRALLEERRRVGEIVGEEYEALLDRMGLANADQASSHPESVAVSELIRAADRVILLGDPGTGKTTLLRYLALRHAQATLGGVSMISAELGPSRLPLYVRAGDLARSRHRDAGVRAFIAAFLCEQLECPVEVEALDELVASALRAGRCLVLIDGLDEVTTAQDRASVVASITNFVSAYQPRGNRFVCTSRISGYAAAPLPRQFAAARLLEMDDAAIQQFLGLYVPAIERAEAASKSSVIAQRDADRTVDELIVAFAKTPGVRRLAANPLLLTALLLVHRTHGALPVRRVDAYKAVTDALAHTWRVKQGVPETELPDERRLTLWLTRLADWMHANRPEGSATVRDLLEQWGPLWAKLQREPWDPSVLETADPAASDAGLEILAFVDQVERHSGLLVERAPRRWGFPHLTFEEFYTGRALAYEGRASDRAAQIRRRLHDARYDEPILLALGLIGREQPEELEAIFEASVLAKGEDAERLRLHPSEDEDLLGRDFRFALRALADDIPAAPQLIDTLLKRALDEALDLTGRARFTAYRRSLLERLEGLMMLKAGEQVAVLLAQHVTDEPPSDEDSRSRLVEVAAHVRALPAIAGALVEIVTKTQNTDTAIAAARVLGDRGELSDSAMERLIDIIANSGSIVPGYAAAKVLGDQGELPESAIGQLIEIIVNPENADVPNMIVQVLKGPGALPSGAMERLNEIITHTEHPVMAITAARVLASQGELSGRVIGRLIEIVANTKQFGIAYGATEALSLQSELPDSAVERLIGMVATNENPEFAYRVGEVLRAQRELPDSVIGRVIEIIACPENPDSAMTAARVLRGRVELPGGVIERLIEIITQTEDPFRVIAGARVLAWQGELPGSVIERLIEIITETEDSDIAIMAAQVVGERGELPGSVIERLIEIIASPENMEIVSSAAELLGAHSELPGSAIERLVKIITTSKNPDTISGVAQALGDQGELSGSVIERLIEIIANTEHAENDEIPYIAEQVLAWQGELPGSAIELLTGVATSATDYRTRVAALGLIAKSTPSPILIDVLLASLIDPDNDVRKAASNGLASFGARYLRWRDPIRKALGDAIVSRDYAPKDRYEQRTGNDYAYDGLWRLTELESSVYRDT